MRYKTVFIHDILYLLKVYSHFVTQLLISIDHCEVDQGLGFCQEIYKPNPVFKWKFILSGWWSDIVTFIW